MKKLVGKRKRKQPLPAGWTEKQVAELAAYYDNQTEEEQLAEHRAARAKIKKRPKGVRSVRVVGRTLASAKVSRRA